MTQPPTGGHGGAPAMDHAKPAPVRCKTVALIAILLLAVPSMAMAAEAPRVAIADGARFETVYDWAAGHCETWDVPDAPLRAFRNAAGEVVALASDKNSRPFIGPRLDAVHHVCRKAYVTRDSADPADFSGWGYVVATWTEDGKIVHGLVHNEYHAERFPGACRYREPMACWYNAVVAVRSTDGGHTFLADDPPALVAAAPFRQEVEQGRHRGFFSPSNIVAHDGWFYTVIDTTGAGTQAHGGCVFRTRTLADPHSWRAFDGTGYTSRAIDPYRQDVSLYVPCVPISGLPSVISALAWSDKAQKFLAVMTVGPGDGHKEGGIMVAWSEDLLHWSDPRLLLDAPSMFSEACATGVRYAYASVLDPNSPSRNFDVLADTPYLYITRFNLDHCQPGPNRDLVRIRLTIQ